MRPPVPALICICLVAMLATLPVSRPASAQQNPFSAAITVDDRAVTWWELDQRARLLAALNLPGDPERAAREQLIDDRLRANVAERIGYVLPEDELQAELLDFAERGGLDIDQLLVLLDREGVAPETLRDYVRWQVTWRAIVQGRYAGQVQITDEEIDNALALAAAGSGTSVLVSELILPRTPQIAEQNRALAQQLSDTIDSTAAFEAAARRYSVAPSAARGGRLDWLPLSELPPELGSLLLTLAPGDVTEALVLPEAIVLFQLRAIREQAVPLPAPNAIDYLEFWVPGTGPAARQTAGALAARMDSCDDVYGQGRLLGETPISRETRPTGSIPRGVAFELAKLDPNEFAILPVPSVDGQGEMLRFLMLCSRVFEVETLSEDQAAAREAARAALFGQRLQALADSFLAELRAEARIEEM
ncbi:MAG: peptidylprolyl isomerase [Rhodobacteraceae bacterium]|nr:peptidylprolyl isomerase [Paracoccaceae bacterium]